MLTLFEKRVGYFYFRDELQVDEETLSRVLAQLGPRRACSASAAAPPLVNGLVASLAAAACYRHPELLLTSPDQLARLTDALGDELALSARGAALGTLVATKAAKVANSVAVAKLRQRLAFLRDELRLGVDRAAAVVSKRPQCLGLSAGHAAGGVPLPGGASSRRRSASPPEALDDVFDTRTRANLASLVASYPTVLGLPTAVTGTANPFYGIDVGAWSKPAFADVDGDGDLDLVVGEYDGTLFYYENVGSAASPSYEAVTGAANPFDGIDVGWHSAPALADLDGDGDLDLVVGEDDGTLFYYENVGSAASPDYAPVTGAVSPFDGIYVLYSSAPALADLDGDGDLDLVVGEDYGDLFYYENVGSAASPSYEAVTDAANPFDGIYVGWSSNPALADLDSDGDLDLVVGEQDGGGVLNYFEIVGSAASPSYEAVTGSASPFDGIDVGYLSAPALVDLDGDGDLDLVVGEEDGVLNYYETVGSATSPSFEARTGTANPFDGIDVGSRSKPALADLDGDGDLDLVVGEVYGFLYYYENVGSAASPDYAPVTGTANPFYGIDVGWYSSPAFVDLDGDGDVDLVLASQVDLVASQGVIYYYDNVGSATSPSYAAVTGSANPFDAIAVGSHSTPALADLDGDGDLDLVVGEGDGVLSYYENVGSAASPDYAPVTGTANPFYGIDVGGSSKPAFADLDGDGDLDLVVGETDGVLNFYVNGYCTQGDTACSSKGLCDLTSVIFSEASCQCLGGFDHEVPDVVMQCGECQAGFYGSTCEPCPQGGDEDRNAPRLTDTCGVAGSGRSRGSCDDGRGGTGACACFGDVFSGAAARRTCPAGTVETATFDGYFNIANCVVREGTFSAGRPAVYEDETGQSSCKLADAGFFVDAIGASEQTACDAGKYSGSGADETYQGETGQSSCALADAGSFVQADGASEQTACDAGKYSGSGADECVDCEAGTYQDATGQSSCALADAGSFVQADGASEQTACDAGKYSGSGASECDDCAAGTYQDATGQSSCALADGGSFVQADGASEQTACDAGKYSGSGADECVDCEAGTYQDATGQSSCALADAGSFVQADGASEQTACDAGKYSGSGAATDGASEQTACDAGKYSGSGADECIDCEAGTYQDATGQSSCKLADGGSFVDAMGASEQRECPAGSFSGSASGKCDDCAAGTFQVLTGQSSCALAGQGFYAGNTGASEQTACPAGSFSGSGASECLDCEAGTYQDATGQSSCKLAEAGSFVASTGASASTPCFAGSYAATASSECATCEVGTYSTEGSDTCTLCPSGYSSDAEGASECEACPVGKYKGAGSGPCLDCAAAKYADEEASSDCKLAEAGSFVASTGASASTPCSAACPVGKYKGAGSGPCLDCAAAKYADEEGSSDCKLAEAGSFVASTGASASTPCFAGSYAATASSECATCEVGTYSTEGSDTCTLCPSGYSSDAEGASECEACPVGKYKGAGSGPCLDCAAAKYADEEASSDCKLAEAGSFVASTGASASTPCFAGSYAATASSECATCEVGTYSTEGDSSCTSCPAGFSSSAAGASECSACPVGTFKGAGSGPCVECGAGTFGPETGQSSCLLANSGFFVNDTGASEQTACPAGSFSGSGASECDECERGTYQSLVGQASCALADGGSFVNEIGASEQTACPAGNFSGSGASACDECEIGTFSGEGESSCTSCPAGYSSSSAGASECSACPVGTFKGAGSGPCIECGVGTYGPETGQSSCALADAGSFVNETGASTQTLCDAGKISGSGATECDACQPGTFADKRGATSCQLSNAGSFVGVSGASIASECAAGSYSGMGASACTRCEEGTFAAESGQSSCALSSGGTMVASPGATAETMCPAGRFSGAAASYCAVCPAGTTNKAGEAACTTVDAGKRAPPPEVVLMTIRSSLALNGVDASAFNDDAVANAQLKAALEATLVADLFSFMVDSAGIASVGPAVADGSSAQIWFELEANYTAAADEDLTSTEGLVLEDFELDLLAKIEDGTLQSNIEEAVSSGRRALWASRRSLSGSALGSATVDVEMSSEGVDAATVFTDSPPGGFSTGETSSCPPGTFSSSGASECVECERGSYTDDEGQNVCKLASAGEFVADAGATAQKACAPGKISPGGGSFACDDCEPGTFQPKSGETSCQLSNAGFYVEHSGASNETACPAGKYSGSAAESCTECLPGSFAAEKGLKAHYFYDTAANRCVDCGNKIKASGDNIIGTVLAVLFVVAAIGVVMRKFGIFTVLGHGVDAIREVVQGEAVKDIAKAKLEEHYEDDEDGEAAGSDTQSADDKESGRSMEQNVMTKAKIVIATYQIACSIPWSLPQVRFPTIFKEALKLGSVVNLSFISFAKTECFGDFDYFDKLLFVTLLPSSSSS
ncbi:hypothetical protein JL721_986 [Aureococcus anophagefferens]|nr:hypothetical protein JL721_986 [Aureococcus anophagefferens]